MKTELKRLALIFAAAIVIVATNIPIWLGAILAFSTGIACIYLFPHEQD